MSATERPRRMWINQPSTLQQHHDLHGTNVLAVPEYEGTMCVYFLSDDVVKNRDVISTQMSSLALSEGWRPKQR